MFTDAIEKAAEYKKNPTDIDDQILDELERMWKKTGEEEEAINVFLVLQLAQNCLPGVRTRRDYELNNDSYRINCILFVFLKLSSMARFALSIGIVYLLPMDSER